MSTRLDSIEAQKISADLVAEHVHANVGSMVEYILRQDDRNAPFSLDDIDLYPNLSDWEAEQLNTYLVDEMSTTWEDVTGDPFGLKSPTEEEIDLARKYVTEEDYAHPDTSDWSAETLHDWIVNQLHATWEEATGTEWALEEEDDHDLRLEDQSDDVRNYIRDNAEPAEVYEWWIVSGWLANRLEAEGEIVFDGDIWGRTTTGQAIKMDYVIQKIALARHEQLAKYD